jgi:hypothetical protein
MYCSLSDVRHVSTPIGVWRDLTIGAVAPDMSGDLWLRCSDFWHALFITVHFCSRPLTRSDRCSIGSPDMSGAHQTVRWIIMKRAQKKPGVACSLGRGPGAPDTVRCATGSTLSCPLLQICLCPQLNFFLGLCWTLCTWDKWHLGKLISPRGLWWMSTTKIYYRKWLSPFPFQSPPFWWLMPTQTKANKRV